MIDSLLWDPPPGITCVSCVAAERYILGARCVAQEAHNRTVHRLCRSTMNGFASRRTCPSNMIQTMIDSLLWDHQGLHVLAALQLKGTFSAPNGVRCSGATQRLSVRVIKKGPTAAGLVSGVWAMKGHAINMLCARHSYQWWTLVKPRQVTGHLTLLSPAAHSGGFTSVE